MRTLVVLPAYNEADSLARLLPSLPLCRCLDYLVVDDGSSDTTPKTCKDAGFAVTRHDTRRGRDRCLKTGFDYAIANRFDCVIYMDADGQHSASAVASVRAELKRYTFVRGSRFLPASPQRGTPWDRRFLNAVVSGHINRRWGIKVSDPGCGLIGVDVTLLTELQPELLFDYHFTLDLSVRAPRAGLAQTKIAEIAIPAIYDLPQPHQQAKYLTAAWRERLRMRLQSQISKLAMIGDTDPVTELRFLLDHLRPLSQTASTLIEGLGLQW